MISKEKYAGMIENLPICCVDLIIVHKNKILLLKRKNPPLKNEWWIPGGRLYKNELLKDAVKRKAREEAGIDVEIVRQLGAYEHIFKDSAFEGVQTGTHTVGATFIVKPKNEEINIKVDKDSKGFKWIDKIPEDSPDLLKKILSDSKIFNL